MRKLDDLVYDTISKERAVGFHELARRLRREPSNVGPALDRLRAKEEIMRFAIPSKYYESPYTFYTIEENETALTQAERKVSLTELHAERRKLKGNLGENVVGFVFDREGWEVEYRLPIHLHSGEKSDLDVKANRPPIISNQINIEAQDRHATWLISVQNRIGTATIADVDRSIGIPTEYRWANDIPESETRIGFVANNLPEGTDLRLRPPHGQAVSLNTFLAPDSLSHFYRNYSLELAYPLPTFIQVGQEEAVTDVPSFIYEPIEQVTTH